MLPASLKEPLRNDLMRVKKKHEKDVAAGRGAVALPSALRTKYPNAPCECGWPWVFPATRFYVDQATGRTAAGSWDTGKNVPENRNMGMIPKRNSADSPESRSSVTA